MDGLAVGMIFSRILERPPRSWLRFLSLSMAIVFVSSSLQSLLGRRPHQYGGGDGLEQGPPDYPHRPHVQQEQTNDPAEIDDDHHGQHKDCGAEDKRPSIILVL